MTGITATTPGPVDDFAPGDIVIFHANYTATQTDIDNGSVHNEAIAQGVPPSATTPIYSDPGVLNLPTLQTPKLTLVKTRIGTDPLVLNSIITYNFHITNSGNVTINDISVTDLLPGVIGYAPASIATLAPAEFADIQATYTVTQLDLDRGFITNRATASGRQILTTTTVTSNEATITINLITNPALAIFKESNITATTGVDDVVTYTFYVHNTGDVTLYDISVTDILPELSAISPVSVESLAVDAWATFTATYVVTQEDVNPGQIVNTATAHASDPNDNPIASNPFTLTEPLTQSPNMTMVKSSTSAHEVNADGEIEYTFVVTNTGNVTLTNISVSDPLTGPVTPASISSLLPGTSTTFTATYTVTQNDVDTGNVHNTATANADGPSGPLSPVEDEYDFPITQTPAISVIKSSDAGTDLAVDDVITYEFLIENTGNVTLDSVSISDILPGISATDPLSEDHLVPGETTTFTATYTVTQDDIDYGQIANTATAHATDPNDDPVTSDPSDLTLYIDQTPELTALKTADTAGPVTLNQTITYTIRITNTGNVTLTDIDVTDTLPGLSALDPSTIAELAPGDHVNVSATYIVTQTDMDAGQIVNHASATGTDPSDDPVPSNETTVTLLTDQQPDLTIVKSTDTTSDLEVGDTVTYQFTVTNTGNVTVENITVSDILPGISATSPLTVDSLGLGESVDFTATYLVTQTDINHGLIHNEATAQGTAAGTGDDVTSLPDALDLTIDQNPHLTITKTSNAIEPAELDDVITYTFNVVNDGNVTLTNVSSLTFSRTSARSLRQRRYPSPRRSHQLHRHLHGRSGRHRRRHHPQLRHRQRHRSHSDPVPSEPDTLNIDTLQDPSLLLTKSRVGTGTLAAYDAVTYQFVVQNTGNTTLTNVTISDPLVDLGPFSPTSVASLAPGASTTFHATYLVKQTDIDSGTLVNTAQAHANLASAVIDSNKDTVTITFVRTASLSIDKLSDATADVGAGDTITYRFIVVNTGNVTLDDVTIVDLMPGLTFVAPTSEDHLVPGETTSFFATYIVTQSDVDAGEIENTAYATGIGRNDQPAESEPEHSPSRSSNTRQSASSRPPTPQPQPPLATPSPTPSRSPTMAISPCTMLRSPTS